LADFHQNFLTLANSLDSMLAEAHKYRLSMVLAHQDLAQFPRDLLAAASANARNKLYFTGRSGRRPRARPARCRNSTNTI
jgi:hypothetical protein